MTDHSGETTPEKHAFWPLRWGFYKGRCGWQDDTFGTNPCWEFADHEVHGGREDELCADCGHPEAKHPTGLARLVIYCQGAPSSAEMCRCKKFAEPAAGDAATDVDSTAEGNLAQAVRDLLDEIKAWETEGLGTCPEIDRTNYPDAWSAVVSRAVAVAACTDLNPWFPGSEYGADALAEQVSAGSPVTAGVPDTAACGCVEGYEWRARQDAVCGNCPRRGETSAGAPDICPDLNQVCIERSDALRAALDAARGELVTARGERDALRVELAGVTPEGVEWQYRPWIPPAQRTADDWSSMVAVARNRAWAAEAELAAANARITELEAELAGYDGCCGQFYEEGELRAGVPAAGDAGEETR